MYVLLQEMWSKPHMHWFYPLLIFAISFANGTSLWQPIRQDDLGDGRVQLISWEVNVPKVTLFIKETRLPWLEVDFQPKKNDPDWKKPEPVEINELLHLAPIMAHLLDFVASRVPPLVILWWVHPKNPRLFARSSCSCSAAKKDLAFEDGWYPSFLTLPRKPLKGDIPINSHHIRCIRVFQG